MIHAKKIGLRSKLTRGISPTDTLIRVEKLMLLNPENGHYWLTLDDGQSREFVCVTESVSGGLAVIRGVDDTVPRSFPAGTCISVQWNESALDEFINSRGLPTPIVSPGVYCLQCTTCITINDQGQIVKIDGADSC